jgi:serine/threonine-protein kinase
LKAIDARPGDWRSYLNLGTYYFGQQRYSDAERLYRKVIDITPDNHLGYRNLGGIMTVLGRNEEAETLLIKSLSLNWTPRAASNLATLYMFMGRYRDAVPILEKAAEVAAREVPNEYKIWGNLGDAYWLDGAPAEKKQLAYRHAVKIVEGLRANKPDDAILSSGLAEYYAKLGENGRAVETIESALKSEPKSATVRYQAGLVYSMLGEDDRARQEIKEALARGIAPDQIQHAPEFNRLREKGPLLNVQK